VCGASDARTLVDVPLAGGSIATLCGSHAVSHGRSRTLARSEAHLRELLRDRRDRSERRDAGDELGAALTQAFTLERRERDRRA
jgi:hypothetical protein